MSCATSTTLRMKTVNTLCHSGGGRNPGSAPGPTWIPACAGMTDPQDSPVTVENADRHFHKVGGGRNLLIPLPGNELIDVALNHASFAQTRVIAAQHMIRNLRRALPA